MKYVNVVEKANLEMVFAQPSSGRCGFSEKPFRNMNRFSFGCYLEQLEDEKLDWETLKKPFC